MWFSYWWSSFREYWFIWSGLGGVFFSGKSEYGWGRFIIMFNLIRYVGFVVVNCKFILGVECLWDWFVYVSGFFVV